MQLCFTVVGQAQCRGWIPTCDCVHSWQLYSAASLEHQATVTMTGYPTQLHYPDTEPTSPCTLLIMQSVILGSDMYQFYSQWLELDQGSKIKVQIWTGDLQIPWSPRTGGRRSTHLAIPIGFQTKLDSWMAYFTSSPYCSIFHPYLVGSICLSVLDWQSPLNRNSSMSIKCQSLDILEVKHRTIKFALILQF